MWNMVVFRDDHYQCPMENRNQTLVRHLRALLAANGWSRSDLARRMFGTCTDHATGYVVAKKRERISSWMNGKQYPDPENLHRLAQAFGVTVEDLREPRRAAGVRKRFLLFRTLRE